MRVRPLIAAATLVGPAVLALPTSSTGPEQGMPAAAWAQGVGGVGGAASGASDAAGSVGSAAGGVGGAASGVGDAAGGVGDAAGSVGGAAGGVGSAAGGVGGGTSGSTGGLGGGSGGLAGSGSASGLGEGALGGASGAAGAPGSVSGGGSASGPGGAGAAAVGGISSPSRSAPAAPAVSGPTGPFLGTAPEELDLPSRLAPADGKGRGSVLFDGGHVVRGAPEDRRRVSRALTPVPGTPTPIVQVCRQALARASVRYGAVRIDTASAGIAVRGRRGDIAAPLETRVVYPSEGGMEVRQARVTCRVSAEGRVVAFK